ncbi:hypothetical protein AB834_01150 [PVC group bacterium (ex Bugula neritina AB1)]|nr:hypothetical protein AB834_01150 [PVC group bacterium (ex Bugula neritina AB1)]
MPSHDSFVTIEVMTPDQYKNGGVDLSINYCFVESPLGKFILASTPKGLCHIFFEEDPNKAFKDLQERFPNARFKRMRDRFQQDVLFLLKGEWDKNQEIKLHVLGTPFQFKVWKSLLKIPVGRLSTYLKIAQSIGNPKASRAVGNAIAKNPMAFVIPCHRVISSDGRVGGYRWGVTKKISMISWESRKS